LACRDPGHLGACPNLLDPPHILVSQNMGQFQPALKRVTPLALPQMEIRMAYPGAGYANNYIVRPLRLRIRYLANG
jgi:hypothetical protein